MTDIIVIAVIVAILGLAALYVYKSKKSKDIRNTFH